MLSLSSKPIISAKDTVTAPNAFSLTVVYR